MPLIIIQGGSAPPAPHVPGTLTGSFLLSVRSAPRSLSGVFPLRAGTQARILTGTLLLAARTTKEVI